MQITKEKEENKKQKKHLTPAIQNYTNSYFLVVLKQKWVD